MLTAQYKITLFNVENYSLCRYTTREVYLKLYYYDGSTENFKQQSSEIRDPGNLYTKPLTYPTSRPY